MKAVLDRLVYGMNKYYGEQKGPALWESKAVALLTTCGYPPEKGADLWESGVKRYCKHSQLRYAMLAEHDPGLPQRVHGRGEGGARTAVCANAPCRRAGDERGKRVKRRDRFCGLSSLLRPGGSRIAGKATSPKGSQGENEVFIADTPPALSRQSEPPTGAFRRR